MHLQIRVKNAGFQCDSPGVVNHPGGNTKSCVGRQSLLTILVASNLFIFLRMGAGMPATQCVMQGALTNAVLDYAGCNAGYPS